MKCPVCGSELEVKIDFDFLCVRWAILYLSDKTLPTKNQFEALQKKGFLPTHGEQDGRRWELPHGHYGWAVDYDWQKIARKILEVYISPMTCFLK